MWFLKDQPWVLASSSHCHLQLARSPDMQLAQVSHKPGTANASHHLVPLVTRTVHELLLASLLPCASVRGAGISIHKSHTLRLLLMHWIPIRFARQFNEWAWH